MFPAFSRSARIAATAAGRRLVVGSALVQEPIRSLFGSAAVRKVGAAVAVGRRAGAGSSACMWTPAQKVDWARGLKTTAVPAHGAYEMHDAKSPEEVVNIVYVTREGERREIAGKVRQLSPL